MKKSIHGHSRELNSLKKRLDELAEKVELLEKSCTRKRKFVRVWPLMGAFDEEHPSVIIFNGGQKTGYNSKGRSVSVGNHVSCEYLENNRFWREVFA